MKTDHGISLDRKRRQKGDKAAGTYYQKRLFYAFMLLSSWLGYLNAYYVIYSYYIVKCMVSFAMKPAAKWKILCM